MKKKDILITVLSILIIIITSFTMYNKTSFSFEEKYYKNNTLEQIDLKSFKALVDKKESFGVFIYQPMCQTSANFEKVLNDFQEKYQISFKKISFSEVKDSLKFLKYYPSFIIYKKGKMVDFLEADKDKDVNAYETVEGFDKWLKSYVNYNEKEYNISSNEDNKNNNDERVENNNIQNENTDNNIIENQTQEEKLELEDVIKEAGKVNIYLFWGDGCPHCEKEQEFFKEINNELGKYYNLHKFEVWHSEENKKIYEQFAIAMDDEAKGVPYTIIGEKVFYGFGDGTKEEIKAAILEQKDKSFDVYFDKIRK